MKKSIIFNSIFILLLACFYTNNLKAQFLKKIINTVKNTADNRANDEAAKGTNKVIDKTLDGTKSTKNNSSTDPGDSAATNKVFGAFAKAAQDNPNDTSMSDLLGKSMGNLAGGGVSAADSSAAIKSYMSADGGSGTYYEYSIETKTKKNGAAESTSKIYFTSNGEGRSEMNIAAMMGAKNSSPVIVIGRANQPQYSVIIDGEEKSYSLNVIDTALINGNFEKYKVTKIGNENVGGYNCIHARVVSTAGSGMFKSSSTMEVWTSVDVPGYSAFNKAALQQNVQPAMNKALNDAGCAGFLVKMTNADTKDYYMIMQLTKAEKQTFPASLFKIPAGYTESKSNLMFGNVMKAVPKK